jgi:hypothetical protein
MTIIDTLKTRAIALKAGLWKGHEGSITAQNVQGAIQSALTILESVYGNNSIQQQSFLKRIARGQGRFDADDSQYDIRVARDVVSAVDAAIADLDSGVTSSISMTAKTEILGDFLALARGALDTGDPSAQRVAAVLTAAALEETLKQLGFAHDLDVLGRDMRGVIEKLRQGGFLVGAQLSLAQGLVKFRDHAFHGQFDLITPTATESAFTFVQQILISDLSR